jgi:hypothetical protein
MIDYIYRVHEEEDGTVRLCRLKVDRIGGSIADNGVIFCNKTNRFFQHQYAFGLNDGATFDSPDEAIRSYRRKLDIQIDYLRGEALRLEGKLDCLEWPQFNDGKGQTILFRPRSGDDIE